MLLQQAIPVMLALGGFNVTWSDSDGWDVATLRCGKQLAFRGQVHISDCAPAVSNAAKYFMVNDIDSGMKFFDSIGHLVWETEAPVIRDPTHEVFLGKWMIGRFNASWINVWNLESLKKLWKSEDEVRVYDIESKRLSAKVPLLGCGFPMLPLSDESCLFVQWTPSLEPSKHVDYPSRFWLVKRDVSLKPIEIWKPVFEQKLPQTVFRSLADDQLLWRQVASSAWSASRVHIPTMDGPGKSFIEERRKVFMKVSKDILTIRVQVGRKSRNIEFRRSANSAPSPHIESSPCDLLVLLGGDDASYKLPHR